MHETFISLRYGSRNDHSGQPTLKYDCAMNHSRPDVTIIHCFWIDFVCRIYGRILTHSSRIDSTEVWEMTRQNSWLFLIGGDSTLNSEDYNTELALYLRIINCILISSLGVYTNWRQVLYLWEVLTAVKTSEMVFWTVTSRWPGGGYQSFVGIHCPHLQE
jgi:hypothetical protein